MNTLHKAALHKLTGAALCAGLTLSLFGAGAAAQEAVTENDAAAGSGYVTITDHADRTVEVPLGAVEKGMHLPRLDCRRP